MTVRFPIVCFIFIFPGPLLKETVWPADWPSLMTTSLIIFTLKSKAAPLFSCPAATEAKFTPRWNFESFKTDESTANFLTVGQQYGSNIGHRRQQEQQPKNEWNLITHIWTPGRSLSLPGLHADTETGWGYCSTYARPSVVLLRFLMKPGKDSEVELNKSIDYLHLKK